MSFLQGFARKLGVLEYQGTWNASTNSPALSNASGSKGQYYVVATAGSTALGGVSTWDVGDWLIHNGTTWQRLDAADKAQMEALIGPSSNLYEDNAQVFADGRPGIVSPHGNEGWYFTNTFTSGINKINWYFTGVTEATIQLGQVSSFYAIVTLHKTRLPFLNLYTVKQNDGQDAASWYRSRINYVGTNPATPGTYLLYVGTNPSVQTHLPRIQLTREQFTARGPEAATEVILASTLQTDSSASAGTVEFTARTLALNTQVKNLRIRSSMTIEACKRRIDYLTDKIEQLERT